jgi:two-component system sensor histidine kinase YesM
VRGWFQVFFNNLKIREKFTLIICLIMLGVCLISMVAFYAVTDLYEQRIHSESVDVLNLSSSTVDTELRKIEDWTFRMATDLQIQQDLTYLKEKREDYEIFNIQKHLKDRMMEFMQQESYFASLQISNAPGQKYTTVTYQTDDNDKDYDDIAQKARGSHVWIAGQDNSGTLVAARQIREMRNTSLSHQGSITAWIDMDKLVKRFLDLSEGKLFMISHNGDIIFSNNRSFPVKQIPALASKQGFQIVEIDGEKYLISYLSSKTSSALTYYNVIPYEWITRKTAMIRTGMISFFAVLFLLVLWVSRKVAHGITRPIVFLTDQMKMVQRGNFEIGDMFANENLNLDETGQLQRNFRIMLEKINELFRENYKKQMIIHETEYRALQAQINPHFLYNTLNTVNWMAKMSKHDQISEVVEALGHMLRSIIGRKDPLIPIAKELQIVQDYVVIQKSRFGARLDFVLSIAPGAEAFVIPKLTIQPIVENAIQHGLEMSTTGCRIVVDVSIKQAWLEITVSDNGPGMDGRTLKALRDGTLESKKTGIGIKNIEDRIKLLFGDPFGLEFASVPGSGTVVCIRIPCQRGDGS